MKKILVGFLSVLLFIGCSATVSNENVTPKLVVGSSLAGVELSDQFEKMHTIDADTKKVIFAFSKASAHTCNDYFNSMKPSYLSEHKTQFVADVSAAPSLIRSMFILPGLKDFKHTVLILNDKAMASEYTAGVDIEKIVVVSLDNNKIINIATAQTIKELVALIEEK